MNLELIEWLDHNTHSYGWKSPDEIKDELLTCFTAGFVVKETKYTVVVGLTTGIIDDEITDINQCITIGKKLIISRKTLVPKAKKK